MTEIRIYEDHDKVVICAETSKMTDSLFDIQNDPSCECEWKDEEYTYIRMPLEKFMSYLKANLKNLF